MVIRTHRHCLTVHFVPDAVIEAVADYERVKSSRGVVEYRLCLAGAETRTVGSYNESFILRNITPLLEIIVHFRRHILAALHTDDCEIAVRRVFEINV